MASERSALLSENAIDMRIPFRATLMVPVGVAILAALGTVSTAGQSPIEQMPRAADGKPDLTGAWQAINTANWDIQDHAARQGPVVALGAHGKTSACVRVMASQIVDFPVLLAPSSTAKRPVKAQMSSS